jgi:hypothetical protein
VALAKQQELQNFTLNTPLPVAFYKHCGLNECGSHHPTHGTSPMNTSTAEHQRLFNEGKAWKQWGPYVSDRAWSSVREDNSPNGNAWSDFPHDHARSRAYRWNEDGIGGISDDRQFLCFAPAFWNGRDPILKERFFGLENAEGNHGEDVKEYYFYTDSTPTHSFMRMIYKYPHQAYPYDELVGTNKRRNRNEPEYELIDTGIFNENRYFDIAIDYAKAAADDILIRIEIFNRGKEKAPVHVLPTLWFRNTWSWGADRQETVVRPSLRQSTSSGAAAAVTAEHQVLGTYVLSCDRGPDGAPDLLFTENETNKERLFGHANSTLFVKDGINNYLVHGHTAAVNPERRGTKASAHYKLVIPGGKSVTLRLRLRPASAGTPAFADFDEIFASRQAEADAFYATIQPAGISDDLRLVQRQAWAGMLWSKQFYHYNVATWLRQDSEDGKPVHRYPRNTEWHHFEAADIISMPDKWEYPWFAAWDLAFHTIPLAYVDPDFAKEQLKLLCTERYQHPNGAISAYEWNFNDVNPPVLARAARRVYQIDEKIRGKADTGFLEYMFQKLGFNYTWWVNRKDASGNNLFEGGFLGLDNIGVFDRSAPLPTGGQLEQADGTSWMGVFTLDMLAIATELSHTNAVYGEMAAKYMIHFFYLNDAFNDIGGRGKSLWDKEDGFYYDLLNLGQGNIIPLKIRSMVGLIPLFATVAYRRGSGAHMAGFRPWLENFVKTRPEMASILREAERPNPSGIQVLSMVDREKLSVLLGHMLSEKEFLSDYGIRALSRDHLENPYTFYVGHSAFSVSYLPGESDSGMFGGNSNWRGPIWMPVNYFLITALKRFNTAYGDDLKVEYPSGSGRMQTLDVITDDLTHRLAAIFTRNAEGKRPVFGDVDYFNNDPHWRDLIPFYEYFHGDTGRGIGASHQTGWTGLIAALIQELGEHTMSLRAATPPAPVQTPAPAMPAPPVAAARVAKPKKTKAKRKTV